MEAIFEKWCEKLLDTGKGNRLINFKESKFRTIEILSPDIQLLFDKISNGETLSFYDVDGYIKSLKQIDLVDEDFSSEIDRFNLFAPSFIVEKLSSKLNKKQILAYKKGFTLKKVLTSIKKIANTSILEKGINVLYLAFGLLSWKDSSNFEYKSPLLLVPILLENELSKSKFTITEYEDEVNTNPTLIYKFKNELGLRLPEFCEENYEEETLLEYLDRVSTFASKQGWTVENVANIGTFSFLKLNMYKDLKENQDKILSNPTVLKLLNKNINEKEKDEKIDIEKYFDEGNELSLHNVVDADSSQIESIVNAKSGKSFVLQGPPGTGKSQTITNLIAEFLYDGKKILFVSEKLAALNVVFNNLKRVGLSDFCLELHSNKTNKKDVISELYRILDRNKKTLKSSAQIQLNELKSLKKQLDDYASVIHEKCPIIDLSPYEIAGELSKYSQYNSFEYVIDNVEFKNVQYLNNITNLLDKFISFTEIVGYDYRKYVWYGYKKTTLTYQEKVTFKNNLSSLALYIKEVFEKINEICENLNVTVTNFNELENLYAKIKFLTTVKYFNPVIFNAKKIDNALNSVKSYNESVKKVTENIKLINEIFSEEIFELNLKEYYLKFRNEYSSPFRFLNKNYLKDFKVLRSYQHNYKKKFSYQETLDFLKSAKELESVKEKLAKQKATLYNLLSLTDKEYDFNLIEAEISKIKTAFCKEYANLTKFTEKEFASLKKQCNKFVNFYESSKTENANLLTVQKCFDLGIFNLKKLQSSTLITKLNALTEKFDLLDNYMQFYELLNQLSKNGVLPFIELSIKKGATRTNLSNIYRFNFYSQWYYYVINSNQTLKNFSRLTQDNAVKAFKEKDKLKFEISKAEIITKVTSDMPSTSNIASGSQVSALVREANKKSKQKPVRLLLKDIGVLIQKLKPCFLMSPLSVSTYLDSDTCKFDVVIFDEASQIFPWDAIGAISRAKQVIVVGDSKQMPPSNFFNAGMIDEDVSEEDYDDDSLDFESILDISSTVFNQNKLNWHYRSKTEDLISFSNENFYDGNLVTFPSAHKYSKDTGIEFYYTEDGVFDRKSKTNHIEAQKVADLVFEHAKNHPDRSLGVVAFSISQQDAIEDIILKRREENDLYGEFFDSKKDEPFFIKNLETVQGDERDTIIFSVAYAKDNQGKFLHNFGPLNKKGGERRLNVAVTRAKYNIKLVSSIKTYDIDLKRTSSIGAKLLKDYLNVAENGIDSANLNENLLIDKKGFEEEIYNFLTENGYKCEKNIGCSEYKIDIGVKHPTKNDFILAIECDGETYKLAKTTRDRDRLRQEVLEKLGWNFYRIWSTEWFRNKTFEQNKLLERIEKAISTYGNTNNNYYSPNSNIEFINEEIQEKQELKSLFKEYENYDVFSKPHVNFSNTLRPLLEMEAPITEELLLKKISVLFGREKVTDNVREKFYQQLKLSGEKIYKMGDYFVLDPNAEINLRIPKEGDIPRDIALIPSAELTNGMLTIIQNNIGITKDGLFKTITNLLGFTRIGTNIENKLNTSLLDLILAKKIKEIDGEYFLCE